MISGDRRTPPTALVLILVLLLASAGARGDEDDLAKRLRSFNSSALPAALVKERDAARLLGQDTRRRLQAANERESTAWQAIRTRADWTQYRDLRLKALRASLGEFPPPPKDLKVRTTRKLEGKGYRIENLVYQSRPGVLVTANLYLPGRPPDSMPGVLICHSHHNPKTQGELQDMGVLWARRGCMVLVMDQLGHGERRQHPFPDARSYAKPFKPSRQDYYFRYNAGMQLHLVGDSLIGWMVWDLMRGVDLLLARPGIDRERIFLLGAVAGGGDPAAVTAALDRRIAAAVVFNFGGPQPESSYPLPSGAKKTFAYAGSGSWESTRNLRLSARDGFLPWVIVGAIAPRRLVYAHEFSWDQAHDPVWARLEKIYGFYDARDRLAALHGRGRVSGRPPTSSHCNNIGPLHREGIHSALKRWFYIPAPAKEETARRPAADLLCLTPALVRERQPRMVHQLAGELAKQRSAAARQRRAALKPAARKRQLRAEWTRLLGNIEPPKAARVVKTETERLGSVMAERMVLEVEHGMPVPLVVLLPPHKSGTRLPVVVAVAQGGKEGFLKHRAVTLARLLQAGVAVVLPDVRGTGETKPGADRGRNSAATAISSSELMLGQTPVGGRLRDLRAVLRYLRGRYELDPARVALWGDSFAPPNARDREVVVPLDAGNLPEQAEPLGGLLALLGALYEDEVRAVLVRGGLSGYQSLLQSPFCWVPHDVIVPGVLATGDLGDVAAALAPRPLHFEGLVDGLNREISPEAGAAALAPVGAEYRGAGAAGSLQITEKSNEEALAKWLREHTSN